MRTRHGFTLIELMIVVAIIAVIAAIAIPSLLRARLTSNATAAAASSRNYATAQEVYRRGDYDTDSVLEYALRMTGDNSLLETRTGSGDLALIDKSFAGAEGNPGVAPIRSGYVFTILTSQGTSALGGARDYVDPSGNLLYGYAFCATPGAYDSTGRETFMVNSQGVVLQKDRGLTGSVAHETIYDPDSTWIPTE